MRAVASYTTDNQWRAALSAPTDVGVWGRVGGTGGREESGWEAVRRGSTIGASIPKMSARKSNVCTGMSRMAAPTLSTRVNSAGIEL